ncbi:MAG: hypothetical protein J5I90_04645 [Caldilineales bacterium]|nr:hypothetical protein [Caldilineales bacterium]
MREQKGSGIGTLGEGALHAQLKARLAQPGDEFEVVVDGYVIDIVRGDLLIEVQTRNFSAMRRKLRKLLECHQVIVAHPIAMEKWIVRVSDEGEVLSRRKSPKRGRTADVFYELVRIPHLLTHPNLSVLALGIHEEEIRVDDGRGSWRRKGWSIHDRRLLKVISQAMLAQPANYLAFLPSDLRQPFTNRELAEALNCRISLAQKMTYTLRGAGLLEIAGKQGNAYIYMT